MINESNLMIIIFDRIFLKINRVLQTEQLTFLWIIFVMIVFGNCSVLVTLSLSKNRKTRMNFFIMHLAIADLMVGLINVLTDIIWRMTVAFYAGNIACKVIKYLQVSSDSNIFGNNQHTK
ncbi:cardioacceleratory peptide receptor-like protein [Dinothrombium tinctorium]|uniref:Cardioacceleratory peptide receptor-like protein n=1 Tax=Dinothrombium tinctorium TaxID=1965070 RepID=A0A3S4QT57_9ACAR|nr:cardioacceleratory peptide receptor-like protein [Dinothrombium tinctorium]RWS07488.1 cardioacceleratory peptide receptor-like protein [Dinothrombium tinctorium]RWS07638.1 cardioacceleratory peptide receptor-like protein [Dinothrombium tinctorium]